MNLAIIVPAMSALLLFSNCGGTVPQDEEPPAAGFKAMVVRIDERMGCLVERKLLREVSAELSAADETAVSIQSPAEAMEDRTLREALLVFLPAGKLNAGKQGFLALQLWCDPDENARPASFLVDHLTWDQTDGRLGLRIKQQARIQHQLYFLPQETPVSEYVLCPESAGEPPLKKTDWLLYPLEATLPLNPDQGNTTDWQELQADIDDFIRQEFRDIGSCWEALAYLNKKQQVAGESWHWSFPVDLPAFRNYLEQLSYVISAELVVPEQRINLAGQSNFPPQLRQTLLLDKDGATVGAEILLRNDR